MRKGKSYFVNDSTSDQGVKNAISKIIAQKKYKKVIFVYAALDQAKTNPEALGCEYKKIAGKHKTIVNNSACDAILGTTMKVNFHSDADLFIVVYPDEKTLDIIDANTYNNVNVLLIQHNNDYKWWKRRNEAVDFVTNKKVKNDIVVCQELDNIIHSSVNFPNATGAIHKCDEKRVKDKLKKYDMYFSRDSVISALIVCGKCYNYIVNFTRIMGKYIQ